MFLRSPMEPGLQVKNTFANGMISAQCDPQRDLLGYPKFQLASMGKSMGRYKCFREAQRSNHRQYDVSTTLYSSYHQ